MDKPKVSVITPTYNRAASLLKSITSVLEQDFEDFELIVVDDGSTDQTNEVVGQIQACDHRVHYIKLLNNRGVGFARDIGLRHACGKYIAWVDSDDLWLSGKLVKQISVMDLYSEIDILFGDYWNINKIKGTTTNGFSENKSAMGLLKIRPIRNDLFLIDGGVELALLSSMFIHLQTALFRASTVDQIGGFDSALRSAEDFEFLWRAALFGAHFAYLDFPLMERHKDETSITAQSTLSWSEKLEALHRCRRWCEFTGRSDLLNSIAAAEERARRNLIWAYGLNRQRGQALRIYLDGLIGNGVSWPAFVSIAVSLCGHWAMLLFNQLGEKYGIRAKSQSKTG